MKATAAVISITLLLILIGPLPAQSPSDSPVVYVNSFEAPADTSGWFGLGDWMLVEDPAPGQGSRSLLIGGGCLQPVAWIDIPCTTGDGTYRLSFWGKAGEVTPNGGSVVVGPVDWNTPLSENIQIWADSLDWTFYQAEGHLNLGGIDTLRIQIWVGGIVYDDVQLDGLEVMACPALAADPVSLRPLAYHLNPAFPNPFNPATTITYGLPKAARVRLVVYDILGREIVRLVDGISSAGYHRTFWQGRDDLDREVPSGVYIARLVTPEHTTSIKMVLMK